MENNKFNCVTEEIRSSSTRQKMKNSSPRKNRLLRIPGDNLFIEVTEKEKAFRKKLFRNVSEVATKVLECTVCKKNVKREITSGSSCFVHSALQVLVCKKCKEFYGDGYFSLDEEGDEKFCRWCGQGGNVFLCDICTCSFCKSCIVRNFGKRAPQEMNQSSKWICYICQPEPLFALRANAWAAMALYLKTQKLSTEDKKKQEVSVNRITKIESKSRDFNDDSNSSMYSTSDSDKKLLKVGRQFLIEMVEDFVEFSKLLVARTTKIQSLLASESHIKDTNDVLSNTKKLQIFLGKIHENVNNFEDQLNKNLSSFKNISEYRNKSNECTTNQTGEADLTVEEKMCFETEITNNHKETLDESGFDSVIGFEMEKKAETKEANQLSPTTNEKSSKIKDDAEPVVFIDQHKTIQHVIDECANVNSKTIEDANASDDDNKIKLAILASSSSDDDDDNSDTNVKNHCKNESDHKSNSSSLSNNKDIVVSGPHPTLDKKKKLQKQITKRRRSSNGGSNDSTTKIDADNKANCISNLMELKRKHECSIRSAHESQDEKESEEIKPKRKKKNVLNMLKGSEIEGFMWQEIDEWLNEDENVKKEVDDRIAPVRNIVEHNGNMSESDDDRGRKISHEEGKEALETAIRYVAQQPMSTLDDILNLKRWHDFAVKNTKT